MPKPLENRFKRIEKKYLIEKEKLNRLMVDFKQHLVEDDYPLSTITNVYFDSDDFQLVRNAIAKKNEREKIRMRSYITNPSDDSTVFLELKKKDAQKIGHKFRMTSNLRTIMNFMEGNDTLNSDSSSDRSLIHEINHIKNHYHHFGPRMYIYYERYSLKEKHHIPKDPSSKIRITVDQNILYRDCDLDNLEQVYGDKLIEKNQVIMEIKTPGEQPQWLKELLDKHQITSTSFSKYANAYRQSQRIEKAN